MKVALAAGDAASKEWSFAATPAELDLAAPAGYEVRYDEEVRVVITVRRVGEEFFLEGVVTVGVTYTCVRCLRGFHDTVSAPVNVIVHRVTAPGEETGEVEPYVEVPLGTPEFDVSAYAREATLLALDPTPHCRPDCRGLCARCGADLNFEACTCGAPEPDPRWEGLKQLKMTNKR